MRAATDMLAQKVTDKQARELKPLALSVHNYGSNGVKCRVLSQLNFEMSRGYKCELELEDHGRTMTVIVDRDELVMMLGIEGK